MKIFLKNLFQFPLPLIGLFICVEIFIVHQPSVFKTKADYIKNNPDVELLILGSSHSMTAINPEYLPIKSANLAHMTQDVDLSLSLFYRYVNTLKNLRIVILELDYHTLEYRFPDDFYTLPWYYRYHNIKEERISFIKKHLLYLSAPRIFNNHIKEIFNPFKARDKLNEYGSVLNDYGGVFMGLNHDEVKIHETAVSRLKNLDTNRSLENLAFNKKEIDSFVEFCNKNNIKIILLNTPFYDTYIRNYDSMKVLARKQYVDSLVNQGVLYLNYELDKRFNVTDFKDDAHLNSAGAAKFSKILAKELIKLEN